MTLYNQERIELWEERTRAVLVFADLSRISVWDLLMQIVDTPEWKEEIVWVSDEIVCVRAWIFRALGLETESKNYSDLPINEKVSKILGGIV